MIVSSDRFFVMRWRSKVSGTSNLNDLSISPARYAKREPTDCTLGPLSATMCPPADETSDLSLCRMSVKCALTTRVYRPVDIGHGDSVVEQDLAG